jgi:hypothetical protein
MFATPDFNSFDPRSPLRFPQPSIESVGGEISDKTPGVSQIYAAAWGMAQRDYELDRLFNVEFYEGQ